MVGDKDEFLKKYLDQYFCLKGIMLSDEEGQSIQSCFHDSNEESEKYIETSTLLISALMQTNTNLQKTRIYSQLKSVNFYYKDFYIHMEHSNNLMAILFLSINSSVDLAKDISVDLLHSYEKLNSKIPEIRSQF